jgi:uncharacterized protein (DUF362 family)
VDRRHFFVSAATAASAGCARNPLARRPQGPSPVAILKATSYSLELTGLLLRGLAECGLAVKGKSVLVKPNFVEFSRETAINTHPALVAAAVMAFEKLGASMVRVAEGPGHRRDTIGLAEEAGFREAIPGFDGRFIDLNRDDVAKVRGFDDHIYLPESTLAADLVVSMPKLKTHHWAGATLSMKNFFGVVPGSIYGWPKNMLHHYGIPESIVELSRIYRRTFAIVDGITGMDGNGPIQGKPRQAGVVVMGADLAAVDSTCCRVMGIDPEKIRYLQLARHLGNTRETAIEQRGEPIAAVRTDFDLMSEWRHLRLG